MEKLVQSAQSPRRISGPVQICSFVTDLIEQTRAPLEAVIGFADLLGHESLTDEQQDYVQTVLQEGRELQKWLSYIILYTRIESGRLKAKCDALATADIMSALQQRLLHRTNEKANLTAHIEPHTQIPDQIVSDPLLLRQCLGIISDVAAHQNIGNTVELHVDTCPTDTHLSFSFRYQGKPNIHIDRQPLAGTEQWDINQLRLLLAGRLAELLEGQFSFSATAGDYELDLVIPIHERQ